MLIARTNAPTVGQGRGGGGLVCTSIALAALETKFAVQAKSIQYAARTISPPYS